VIGAKKKRPFINQECVDPVEKSLAYYVKRQRFLRSQSAENAEKKEGRRPIKSGGDMDDKSFPNPPPEKIPFKLAFEIPGLPSTSNVLNTMTYRERSEETRYWRNMVINTVFNMRPPRPLPMAKLTLTRFSSSEPDYDNLVRSFKNVIDGLVIGKVLQNDKRHNIGTPLYLWKECERKFGKISVAVEEHLG
jgi:hypothetical protein